MSEMSRMEFCEIKTQSEEFHCKMFPLLFNHRHRQRVDYLIVQAEEVRIVLSHLCLSFRDDLTYVPV